VIGTVLAVCIFLSGLLWVAINRNEEPALLWAHFVVAVIVLLLAAFS
jgi:hypothetical protein